MLAKSLVKYLPLSGNNENISQTAKQQVDEILNSPDSNFRKLGRGGVEARLPDGRGVRFVDGQFDTFVNFN